MPNRQRSREQGKKGGRPKGRRSHETLHKQAVEEAYRAFLQTHHERLCLEVGGWVLAVTGGALVVTNFVEQTTYNSDPYCNYSYGRFEAEAVSGGRNSRRGGCWAVASRSWQAVPCAVRNGYQRQCNLLRLIERCYRSSRSPHSPCVSHWQCQTLISIVRRWLGGYNPCAHS